MRILQVIPCFHPSWGGSTRVARDISRKLAQKGHEITVYASDFGWDQRTHGEKECQERTCANNPRALVKVHFFRTVNSFVVKSWKFAVSCESDGFLKREIGNADIVHLHEYRTFQNILAHRYTRKCNIPYLVQAHGALSRTNRREMKWLYDQLFGYALLRNASKVLAISQVEVQQYRQMGVPIEDIELIPNGIDLSDYEGLPIKGSFRRKLPIENNEKIVLYLGRIHKLKGIDFLLKSFANLIKTGNVESKLVVAGPDDGYLSQAKELSHSLAISDKVLFLSYLSDEERLSAYVDSTVVVCPERFNVFGLVPLEAGLCGKPVIVSNENYMAKIVEGGGFGFSVRYGDAEALSRLLEPFIVDEASAIEMGDRGRQYVVSNFSLEKTVNKLENLYEAIMAA